MHVYQFNWTGFQNDYTFKFIQIFIVGLLWWMLLFSTVYRFTLHIMWHLLQSSLTTINIQSWNDIIWLDTLSIFAGNLYCNIFIARGYLMCLVRIVYMTLLPWHGVEKPVSFQQEKGDGGEGGSLHPYYHPDIFAASLYYSTITEAVKLCPKTNVYTYCTCLSHIKPSTVHMYGNKMPAAAVERYLKQSR